jgi:hypothetical protein
MSEKNGTIAEKKMVLKQTIDASMSYHGNNQIEKDPNENKFPIDIIPSPFKELITECERSLNFPVDYTGIAVITAISIAIGKSAKLKVKNSWYESASIFGCIVGPPGANKSHPIETAFKPLEEIDQDAIKIFAKEYAEYEEYQAVPKKDKSGKIPVDKPILKKTVLHNFTPEVLHQRLHDNDRGCVVLSEELSTWIEGMNNFSKGDTTSIYLSIWSNKSTSIDRVGKPVPLWLAYPFLSIVGSVQPRILTKLFPVNKTDNGFLQRFLFAFPNNIEKHCINDNDIGENVLMLYADWIKTYILRSTISIDQETEMPNPKIYHWSAEAKSFFYEWQKENTDQVNKYADSLKSEIISKFDIHFCRLSLILHIMNDYEDREISLGAVKSSKKLCTYFLNCALKVLNVLGSQSKADGLPEDKKKLYEALPDVFRTGEGVRIAEKSGVAERTFKRFIGDNDKLFKQIKIGIYEKQK